MSRTRAAVRGAGCTHIPSRVQAAERPRPHRISPSLRPLCDSVAREERNPAASLRTVAHTHTKERTGVAHRACCHAAAYALPYLVLSPGAALLSPTSKVLCGPPRCHHSSHARSLIHFRVLPSPSSHTATSILECISTQRFKGIFSPPRPLLQQSRLSPHIFRCAAARPWCCFRSTWARALAHTRAHTTPDPATSSLRSVLEFALRLLTHCCPLCLIDRSLVHPPPDRSHHLHMCLVVKASVWFAVARVDSLERRAAGLMNVRIPPPPPIVAWSQPVETHIKAHVNIGRSSIG